MAIETELKLRIAAADMGKLKRHPFLRSISSGRAQTRKLYSVYFDTPDLYLHRQRMALRLRRVGKQWVQTLKGGGGVQAGLHQRNEWETPVAVEHLDWPALKAMGAPDLAQAIRKNLQPLFITDFSRSIHNIKFEGASIELSLDAGEIRAGDAIHPISELELELKEGAPLQLYRLGLALMDVVPLQIEITSKAEYGYQLHQPIKKTVAKARHANLQKNSEVREALQSLIWSCLSHLQANVSGALNQTHDEYLHQMRVALRQLRVVLEMASEYRADTELELLKSNAGELGKVLGHSREWDVFVNQVLPSLPKHWAPRSEAKAIVRQSKERRNVSHLVVNTTLQAGKFQRLILRLGAWMYSGYWEEGEGVETLGDFADNVLAKSGRKVRQRGKILTENISPARIHKFRIAVKNYRYCLEMFALLYSERRNRHHMKFLIELQDSLGYFNDNTVALRLLKESGLDVESASIVALRNIFSDRKVKSMKAICKAWGSRKNSLFVHKLKGR